MLRTLPKFIYQVQTSTDKKYTCASRAEARTTMRAIKHLEPETTYVVKQFALSDAGTFGYV